MQCLLQSLIHYPTLTAGMNLFLVLAAFYLALSMVALMYVFYRERSILFWALITYVFSPIVTIIFMYYLGDSKSKKEDDAQFALMQIKILECEVIDDWENKAYLMPHLKKRGEERMEEKRMAKEKL